MTGNGIAADRVVSVLLADGWHRIVPGSFSIGPLGFGVGAGLVVPGFRLEEANSGSPYQPTVLSGPLDSIIAVRQILPAEPGRAAATHNGHRAGHGPRPRVPAGRRADGRIGA